jgi:hypothetical protein
MDDLTELRFPQPTAQLAGLSPVKARSPANGEVPDGRDRSPAVSGDVEIERIREHRVDEQWADRVGRCLLDQPLDTSLAERSAERGVYVVHDLRACVHRAQLVTAPVVAVPPHQAGLPEDEDIWMSVEELG